MRFALELSRREQASEISFHLLLNTQREQKLNSIMKPVKALKTGSRKKTSTSKTPEPAKATTPAPAPAVTMASARSATKPITIEAKIDVGFGNALFLRGEGPGLTWNHGIPLTCVDGSTWKWSAEVGDKLKFKLLLNDSVWASGEDMEATPGQQLEIRPVFA
jgi:hypothetical protein